MNTDRFALAAILFVSFGLLVNEIMLSAIFHVLLGAGNTVAAIAIALVGLSASGIVAHALPAVHDPTRSPRLVRVLLAWFSLSLPVGVYAIMAVPISHGDLSFRWAEPSVQLWRLAVYHITVVPFFLGGLTIAAILRREPSRVGRLYFADLFGAALGCLASPFLLTAFGAPGAILAGALPAAALCLSNVGRDTSRAMALGVAPILLVLAAIIRPELLTFSTLNTMGRVEEPHYRSFPIERSDLDYQGWALDAWTIIRSKDVPQQWEDFRGWGLGPGYRGFVPETRQINYNARFSTYVTRRDGDPAKLREWIDADLTSLHHLLGRPYAHVLNIGAGGGRETLAALEHGAERVVAVDVSELVIDDIMQGPLKAFSGALYADPRVEAIADEGRSFAERTPEAFDLLEFSIVGGANLEKMDLVRVDDLFTIEALRTYMDRLRPGGVFSYVMYSTRSDIVASKLEEDDASAQPYIPALRTLTGLRMVAEERSPGIRFGDHVLIAALPGVISPTYDLVHIVASPRPFSEAERRRFVEACTRLGFESLYPLAADAGGSSNPYARLVTSDDLEKLANEAPFSLRPATDDRPFQYALEPGHLLRAIRKGRLVEVISGNPLVSMALTIGALAVLLTLAPLLLSARRAENLRSFRSSWSMFLYFACIGFGFMAVEIAALLRLQSYLGKPIYGLSVGLFAFLLASSFGSSVTGSFADDRLERRVDQIVVGIAVVGLAFVAGSPALFSATIAWPLAARIALAVLAVFPLAFLMGMLFPIGIRLVSHRSADLVPWSWATNGCFSVLGIFSTRIIALLFGFSRALLLGLLAYLLLVVCVRAQARRGRAAGATTASVPAAIRRADA
jgi:SAM-dependent methyltransferase